MKVIIDIPENIYHAIMDSQIFMTNQRSGKTLLSILISGVENGTPLPKGHGRLIDADELYLDIQTDEEMRLGEHLKWVKERFDNAPTIVEAEGEDKECLDTTSFPCNMIVTNGRNVCVVKDTCEGCKYDSDYCAIYGMLEICNLFENWGKTDLPTFRERMREAESEEKDV